MADVDLLSELRAATRASHAALDGRPLARAVLDGSIDPDGYRELIAWQLHAHAHAERGLASVAWPAAFTYTSRQPALHAEHLTETTALGGPALPTPTSLAEATGRAYVLSGSALGGALILRHLEANESLRAFAPFPFYRFQRERGLPEWRAFTAFAKTHPWTAAERAEAARSAVAVFEVFAKAD